MRTRRGFTLIELLVVVVIISILASIATPQYFKVVESARVSEANALLSAIRTGQEGLLARKGAYATSNAETGAFDIVLPGAEPTFGMKYFFAVLGEGDPTGCPPDHPHYNVAFVRYGAKGKVMPRYFENYMIVYERCTNKLTFPGCPTCSSDFKR